MVNKNGTQSAIYPGRYKYKVINQIINLYQKLNYMFSGLPVCITMTGREGWYKTFFDTLM